MVVSLGFSTSEQANFTSNASDNDTVENETSTTPVIDLFDAYDGDDNFSSEPSAELHFTATEVGAVSASVLRLEPGLSEKELAVLADNSLELLLRFHSPDVLRPLTVESGARERKAEEDSLPEVPRAAALHRHCGRWLLELLAEDEEGFPVPLGCSFGWKDSVLELSLHFAPGRSLRNLCFLAGQQQPVPCRYQLVIYTVLEGEFQNLESLAEVRLFCRGGSACFLEEGRLLRQLHVLAFSGSRRPASHVAHWRLKNMSMDELDPRVGALQLVSPGAQDGIRDSSQPLAVSLSFASAGTEYGHFLVPGTTIPVIPIVNVSSASLHVFLAPTSAWDVDVCEVISEQLPAAPCQPRTLGLLRSSLEVTFPEEQEEELDSLWPLRLQLKLPAPRAGLGFFPTQPTAEIRVDGEDENQTYLEQASFVRCQGLWWRQPSPEVATVAGRLAFAQLLVAGRSKFGPTPFVSAPNEMILRLTLLSTVSRMTDVIGAGLLLVLPAEFECLGVGPLSAAVAESLDSAPWLLGARWRQLGELPSPSETDGRPTWERPGVEPHTCSFQLPGYEALFLGQVVYATVKFRNPGTPLAPSDAVGWRLELRSRGLLQEASEPLVMSLPFSTSWSQAAGAASERAAFWQGSVGVLGKLEEVLVQPTFLYPRVAENDEENVLTITLRLQQPLGAGGFLVIDAPPGFDFAGCMAGSLPPVRYDKQHGGETLLMLPLASVDTCAASRWPCSLPGTTAWPGEQCTTMKSLGDSEEQLLNRAILALEAPLLPAMLYGFTVTVRNPPASFAAKRPRQDWQEGWYLWTRNAEGVCVDGSAESAKFNGDLTVDNREPWGLYGANLESSVALYNQLPYSLNLRLSLVQVKLKSPRSGVTGLRITAPFGYQWGQTITADSTFTSRDCWAIASEDLLSEASYESRWPASAAYCETVGNQVFFPAVPLQSGDNYSLLLEVRVPDRLPLLGANAFYLELGHDRAALGERWAAAALEENAATVNGGSFQVLAVSEASVACSCTVASFQANYVRFSFRLPISLKPGCVVRITGDANTAGLTFQSSCAMRTPSSTELPEGASPPLPGTSCRYVATSTTITAADGSAKITTTPVISLTAGPSGWPKGLVALELPGRNPALQGSSASVQVGTWTFAVFDLDPAVAIFTAGVEATEMALKASGVLGCPLRRVMEAAEVVAAPEPYSKAAVALGADWRPGQANRVLLRLAPSGRPVAIDTGEGQQRSAGLYLRVFAPKGYTFPEDCKAVVPSAEQLAMLSPVPSYMPWPVAPGPCAGNGREAIISMPEGLEAVSFGYMLQLAVLNPSLETAVDMAKAAASVAAAGSSSPSLPEAEIVAGDVWSFELGDEASLPIQGPRLQLFQEVRVRPSSHAAGGKPAPLSIFFVPSNTVAAAPLGRLSLRAPAGFQLHLEGCSMVESGGACEHCAAASEAMAAASKPGASPDETGGWCALTSTCEEDKSRMSFCPEEYSSAAVVLAQVQEQGGSGSAASGSIDACSFQLRPSDVRCARPEGRDWPHLLTVEVGGLQQAGVPQKQLVQGRQYELQIMVSNIKSERVQSWPATPPWHLQSELWSEELYAWEPLDLGIGDGFNLNAAALQWRVDTESSRLVALRDSLEMCQSPVTGGDLGLAEAFLQLPTQLLASDEVEIVAPAGVRLDHENGDFCVSDWSVVEAVPPPPVVDETPLCNDPGLLLLAWQTAMTSTTTSTVVTVTVDIWNGSSQTSTSSTSSTASVSAFTTTVAFINNSLLDHGTVTISTSSTTTSKTSSTRTTKTRTTLTTSTWTKTATSTTYLGTTTATTVAPPTAAGKDICQKGNTTGRECLQCVCSIKSCRILMSGLRAGPRTPISWKILITQAPATSNAPAENQWSVKHSRLGTTLASEATPSWSVRAKPMRAALQLLGGYPAAALVLAGDFSSSLKDADWLGKRQAGSTSTFSLELTPRSRATSLRLVAASPRNFDFSGTVTNLGKVLEAEGPSILLDLQLSAFKRVDILFWPVRLGDGGGPTAFHVATFDEEGTVADEVLDLPGFRLPGNVTLTSATMDRQVLVTDNDFIQQLRLPVRVAEVAWLSLEFQLGQRAQAGAMLVLLASRNWELRAHSSDAPMLLQPKAGTAGGARVQLTSMDAPTPLSAQATLGFHFFWTPVASGKDLGSSFTQDFLSLTLGLVIIVIAIAVSLTRSPRAHVTGRNLQFDQAVQLVLAQLAAGVAAFFGAGGGTVGGGA